MDRTFKALAPQQLVMMHRTCASSSHEEVVFLGRYHVAPREFAPSLLASGISLTLQQGSFLSEQVHTLEKP